MKNVYEALKFQDYFYIMFNYMLYFYYDSLNYKLSRELVYMEKYKEQIIIISDKNELNTLIDKLKIIEEIKIKLESNMNLKMLMDEFIIKYSEVK